MKNYFEDKKIKKLKIFCIAAISLASVLMIFAFCGRYFQGGLRSLANFFVGSFGMSFYGAMIIVIVASAFYLAGKRLTMPKKYIANFIVMYLLIVCIVHTLTSTFLTKLSFDSYIQYCYDYYSVPTFGGVVCGIVAFAFQSALGMVLFPIILFALLSLTVLFAVNFLYDYATNRLILDQETIIDIGGNGPVDITPSKETQSIDDDKSRAYAEAHAILFDEKPISPQQPAKVVEKTQDDAIETPPSDSLFGRYPYAPQSKLDDDSTDDQPITGGISPHEFLFNPPPEQPQPPKPKHTKQQQKTPPQKDIFSEKPTFDKSFYSDDEEEEEMSEADLIVDDFYEEVQQPSEPHLTSLPNNIDDFDSVDMYANENEDEPDQPDEDEIEVEDMTIIKSVEPIGNGLGQAKFDFDDTKKLKEKSSKVHQYLKYNTPPTEILDDEVIAVGISQNELDSNCNAIVKKLEVFGIKTKALPPVVGPSVTQYRLLPLSDKIRMNSFSPYSDDLKSCLEATGEIRIEAPIPGTNLVGVEVENKTKRPVKLRTILESKEFLHQKGHLIFAIGQDIAGNYIVGDLGKMPHMLVAGTTGSGKSVALNAMIVSLMFKYSPEYLRFIMIDPKFVELSKYNGTPHLLTSEAITTVQDSIASLDFLIKEMNARYVLLKQNNSSHIDEYNSKINPKYTQKLPYIVLVVDELADIILTAGKTFESKLALIAQKSRAAGIHIVLSTQRPSKDIVTGVIKANIPCRMALKVSSRVNSQIILDSAGAETLVGNGDMLFSDGSSTEIRRIQGCYVSRDEINNIVDFSKQNNELFYQDEVEQQIFASKNPLSDENEEKQAKKDEQEGKKHFDSYCKRALYSWLTKNKGFASISFIQRHLGIGFNRAGKIQDSLIAAGFIEKIPDSDASNKAPKVLVSLEQLDRLFPDQTLPDADE